MAEGKGGKAIPFIALQDGKFNLTPEATEFLNTVCKLPSLLQEPSKISVLTFFLGADRLPRVRHCCRGAVPNGKEFPSQPYSSRNVGWLSSRPYRESMHEGSMDMG